MTLIETLALLHKRYRTDGNSRLLIPAYEGYLTEVTDVWIAGIEKREGRETSYDGEWKETERFAYGSEIAIIVNGKKTSYGRAFL